MDAKLKEKGVTHITVVGLAYDYCVGATARDGAIAGYTTYLVTDATASVAPDSEATMKKCLQEIKRRK